jgi:hypothetical protein
VQEIHYPGRETPYSHQASAGIQRQIGADMSFEANYVYTGGRGEENPTNANLSYNPATGANYPFSNISRRPFPQWGQVNFELLDGWSNYHAGDFTLTKRFSNRWQATGTYTLAYFRDARPVRINGTWATTAWWRGGRWASRWCRIWAAHMALPAGRSSKGSARRVTSATHRAVVNGIWDLGAGFQLSGIYFFGSGERFWVDTGGDRRDEGGTSNTSEFRLRADGSILPRNSLVGKPIHKVDLRLQKRLPLVGRVAIDGMLEVFNLFNHENYGTYVVNESNANFGQPAFSANQQYFPRVVQFGFRTTF